MASCNLPSLTSVGAAHAVTQYLYQESVARGLRMNIADVVKAMSMAGCSSEQIALAVDELTPKRSSAAVRQARYRDRQKEASQPITTVTESVTERNSNVVLPFPLCPPDKEIPPTPPKEINPPISPKPSVSVAAKRRRDDEEWFDQAVRYDYPRKTPRVPALKAWMRLNDTEKAACARAVTEYSIRFDEVVAKSKRSREEEIQFVPHLSTFINQRRWEEIDETA